ncbi:hypothetical protein OAM04_02720 [bacterium]|nr:hypothetical protein [bacterium]
MSSTQSKAIKACHVVKTVTTPRNTTIVNDSIPHSSLGYITIKEFELKQTQS